MDEKTFRTIGFICVLIAAVIGNIGMARLNGKEVLLIYTPYTLLILAIAYYVCFVEGIEG